MEKLKKLFMVFMTLTLVIALGACGGAKKTPEVANQGSQPALASDTGGGKLHSPSPGNCLIYIIRPASLGLAVSFWVYIDGQEIGTTRGRNYLEAEVKPGAHEIISRSENEAKLPLETKAGEVYFIEQQVTMGVVMARNKLIQLNSGEGKEALDKCKKSEKKD